MFRSVALGIAASSLLLIVVPSCTDTDSGSDEGGACASYHSTLVDYQDRCEGIRRIPALPDARSRFESLCANALASPGANNLSGSVAACASALSSATCSQDSRCIEGTGTFADGTACGEGFQCSSSFCSKDNALATCGTCAPRIAIGGACRNIGPRDCVEGALCAGDGKCTRVRTVKAGESCSSGGGDILACENGLTCFSNGGGGTSTCRVPATEGGDCSSRDDCVTGLRCTKFKCAQAAAAGAVCAADGECAKGLVCDQQKCTAVAFVKAGADCDHLRLCERGRCKSADTDEETTKPGKCEDPLPDGAACTPDTGLNSPTPCDLFSKCINSVCTPPNPGSCK